METYDYFNGNSHVRVQPVNKLLELNQEEANLLSTGPQDLFFDKLDRLNEILGHNEISNLDVTDKWNWKPGTYDKMKSFLYKRLYLHKKSSDLYNLVNRTRDRISYLGYTKNLIEEIERQRYSLKSNGYSKDVDVDKFVEKCNEFVNDIIEKCKKVSQITDGKVLMVPYITEIENRNPQLYYDITLSNLELSVFQNETLLQSIPLNDLHIVVNCSLRHKLSNIKENASIVGATLETNGFKLCHPYLQDNNGSYYSRCCFDKHYDDIHKSLNNNDLISFAFLLMQWAQYYNTEFSNPFNQPYMSHLGMPKSFSDTYSATQTKSNVINYMKKVYNEITVDFKSIEKSKYIVKAIEELDCRYTNQNSYYLFHKDTLNIIDSEKEYQIDALVHLIVSKFVEDLNNIPNLDDAINNIADDVSYISNSGCLISPFLDQDEDSDNYGNYMIDDFLDYCQNILKHYFINYYVHNANGDFDSSIFNEYIPENIMSWLIVNGFIVENESNSTDNNEKEEVMKKLMKQWAYSSERG